jgi:DNA mismatch repair protein MutS
VEIQELKGILNRADENSLVLGDELCSGTETTSALCIISAGLDLLCKRKSTFIFTSHLHELTKLEEVKKLENLDIYHLKIEYDKEKDILIYDRKLEKGSGPSIYGLKVCEAMGLSKEFIKFANSVQSNFEKNKLTTTKTSKYNSDIFMDECKMCYSKSKDLETHHIKDQQFADKNNMIDNHHKNVKHNLVPLCKECHLKVTVGERIVSGWKETNHGKILLWEDCSKKMITKKKFSEKDVENILIFRKGYDNLSQKDFLKKLELEKNIKLSTSTLKKMIDDKY